jgi:hypothetical protein
MMSSLNDYIYVDGIINSGNILLIKYLNLFDIMVQKLILEWIMALLVVAPLFANYCLLFHYSLPFRF